MFPFTKLSKPSSGNLLPTNHIMTLLSHFPTKGVTFGFNGFPFLSLQISRTVLYIGRNSAKNNQTNIDIDVSEE